MAGLDIDETSPGMIFDIASSLDDLIVLYRKKDTVEPSFVNLNKLKEDLGNTAQSNKGLKQFVESAMELGVVDRRSKVSIENSDTVT